MTIYTAGTTEAGITLQADRETWEAVIVRLRTDGELGLADALSQRTGTERAERVTVSAEQARTVKAAARSAGPVPTQSTRRRFVVDARDR